MIWPPLILSMLSAAKGDSLPPEANAHNRVAMALYDAGRLEDALVEFRAAYDAMPSRASSSPTPSAPTGPTTLAGTPCSPDSSKTPSK